MFDSVEPGDVVARSFTGGKVSMRLIVSDVDAHFIYCGDPPGGWKFDRASDAEVDEELGWGPQFGVAGSYLTGFEKPASV